MCPAQPTLGVSSAKTKELGKGILYTSKCLNLVVLKHKNAVNADSPILRHKHFLYILKSDRLFGSGDSLKESKVALGMLDA